MKWQEFAKDYLSFTKKERIAIGILVVFILLLNLLPGFLPYLIKKENHPTDTSWFASVRQLQNEHPAQTEKNNVNSYEEVDTDYQYDKTKNYIPVEKIIAGELFLFDPNNTSEKEWLQLGLKSKTIRTIQNYLSKGGQFSKPEDLQRIYGLSQLEYDRLSPFIRIEKEEPIRTFENNIIVPANSNESKTYSKKYTSVDINTADTTAFISLPGIGSRLASRIVNFRDKLGGFYSIDQIGETFGLPDSTFQKIKQYLKLDSPSVKMININTATVDELKAHPYIKFNLANPIVAYRNEHGPFTKIEDIKKVMAVTEESFKKVNPYLSVQ